MFTVKSLSFTQYLKDLGVITEEQRRETESASGGVQDPALIMLRNGFISREQLTDLNQKFESLKRSRFIAGFLGLQIPFLVVTGLVFRNPVAGSAAAGIAALLLLLSFFKLNHPKMPYFLAFYTVLISSMIITVTGGAEQSHYTVLLLPAVLILYRNYRLFAVSGSSAIMFYLAAFLQKGYLLSVWKGDPDILTMLMHTGAVVLQSGLFGFLAHRFHEERQERARITMDIEQTRQEQEQTAKAANVRYLSDLMYLNPIAESVTGESEKIARGADDTNKRIAQEVRQVKDIERAIREMSGFFRMMQDQIQETADIAEKSIAIAHSGQQDIQQTIETLYSIVEMIKKSTQTMNELGVTSGQISEAIKAIERIANQTNLLALNAAIEAARAGEEGRGFAVVADEVSKLADMTQKATADINKVIQDMNNETREAIERAMSESAKAEEGIKIAIGSEQSLDKIVSEINNLGSRVVEIKDMSYEQSNFTNHINKNVSLMAEFINNNKTYIESVTASINEFSLETENLHKITQKFQLSDSILSQNKWVYDTVKKLVKGIEDAFEKGIKTGKISEEKLWDEKYIPIPDTDPAKYHTQYDSFTDEVIQKITDQALEDCRLIRFVALVDRNGYLPTHNTKYSQPLTGRRDHDLLWNRTKRLFNDRTGLRAARNTNPVFIQTYQRDTGEFMNDLSVPFNFRGKHWGAVRAGFAYDGEEVYEKIIHS